MARAVAPKKWPGQDTCLKVFQEDQEAYFSAGLGKKLEGGGGREKWRSDRVAQPSIPKGGEKYLAGKTP